MSDVVDMKFEGDRTRICVDEHGYLDVTDDYGEHIRLWDVKHLRGLQKALAVALAIADAR